MRFVVLLLPGVVACSAQVADGAGTETATKLTAVVEIDRTVSDASDIGHSSAIARFVRSGAGDDGALRLVSAASDLPAIGACAIGSPPSGTAQHPVELLDVGSVTVDSSAIRSTLVARRLPDVVDLVSGVVYTARGPEDGSFGAGHYSLRVAGSSDVPAFIREADGPPVPSAVRVADQDAIGSTAIVDVAWEAGSERDIVLVEVTGGSATTRCTFSDAGHASIAATSFGAQGTLTLHRIHREPFVTAGVDRGEIRFDFARTLSYRHR